MTKEEKAVIMLLESFTEEEILNIVKSAKEGRLEENEIWKEYKEQYIENVVLLLLKG